MDREKLEVDSKFDKYKDAEGNLQYYSYSRVSSFRDCPFSFFLSKIMGVESERKIYSAIGTVVHDVLEKFQKTNMSIADAIFEFQINYEEVFQSGLKFENDELKNDVKKQQFYDCIIHYLKSLKKKNCIVEEKVFAELPIGEIDELTLGYIDLREVEDDIHIITDYKSAMKYSGKELHKRAKQLVLYAIQVHQTHKVPYRNIRVQWDFVKQVNVSYKLKKNDEWKTTAYKRHEYVSMIAKRIKSTLKDLTKLSDMEIDSLIEQSIERNDLELLPSIIKQEYKVEPCIVSYPITPQTIMECHDYMVEGIERIKTKKKAYDENAWAREPLSKGDLFYCAKVCGYSKHCKYYKDYVEKHKNLFVVDEELKQKTEQQQLEELLGIGD